ncbi:GntR family transcriptional regulator [Streptomyces hokutonensis]|uniref:GntR family transcriptional regulator n=1 Tax=Streptomyces hokutonensis TaxID=1306990 RepID=UPI0033C3E064
MPLRAVEPRTERLADMAYQRMCEALVDGTLRPGDRLVMDRLAAELGISRTPVREVLQRLERERVIRPTGGKGYEVCLLEQDDLDQMYQAREAVEGYAAAYVAKAPVKVRRQVADAFTAATRMPLTSPAEVYQANRAIHRAVVEATGNRHLIEMFDLVWSRGLPSQVWADLIEHGISSSDLTSDHEELFAALQSGSVTKARNAAVAHIRSGRQLH